MNDECRFRSGEEDPWEAAEAYGCDMALLEQALRRSPAERIAAHRSALSLAAKLRAAKERADAKPPEGGSPAPGRCQTEIRTRQSAERAEGPTHTSPGQRPG